MSRCRRCEDRKQDIPALATALLADLNRKHGSRVTGLSPEVLPLFNGSTWPGNVRELRNLLERAVIMAGEGEIQLRHLPGVAPPKPRRAAADDVLQVRVGSPMSEVEEAHVRLTLEHANNNKRRAANMLGLCLRTIKLRSYEGNKSRTVSAGRDQAN